MFAIVASVLYIDPNQDPSYLVMYYSVKVGFFLWNGYNATHCNAVSAILYYTMSVSTDVFFACMLGIRHRR